MDFKESRRLFTRARRVIPGGVNSPVRAYTAVEGTPPFIARGKGCRIWDADGNDGIPRSDAFQTMRAIADDPAAYFRFSIGRD